MDPTPMQRRTRLADAPPIAVQGGFLPCPVCGRPMEDTRGKSGRPRETCSPDCREVARIGSTLSAVMATAHPRAKLALRRRLWAALNEGAWNKGLKAGGER